jgi:hypothetical protein
LRCQTRNPTERKQAIPRAETLPIQAKTPTDSKPTAHAAVGRGQQRKRQAARAPRQQHESAGRRSSRPMTAYLKRRYATASARTRVRSTASSKRKRSATAARLREVLMLLCTGRATGAWVFVCSTNARLGNKKTHLIGWEGRGSRARITRGRMREQPFQQKINQPVVINHASMQRILRQRRIGCTRAATGKARQSDRRHMRPSVTTPHGNALVVARIPAVLPVLARPRPTHLPLPTATGLGQYIPLHLAIASREVTITAARWQARCCAWPPRRWP